jgi:mannose/cellobiose epimerase-like protein (N-acyl-D-glucosamine 2-epimerase family)
MSERLSEQAILLTNWLEKIAYPLWSTKGFDSTSGLFHESLDRRFLPINGRRRSMVQARQIYFMSALVEAGLGPRETLKQKIQSSLLRYIEIYQRENGSFAFAVDDQELQTEGEDLYSQAFALFALARGFTLSKDPVLETAATKLLYYLTSERSLLAGGFSEVENSKVVCRSNPHMHLFEAAIEWLEASPSPHWTNLAALLLTHFKEKILSNRLMIAEEFDDQWQPILKSEGLFYFEPGHHYEWEWLIERYFDLSGNASENISGPLYEIANQFGLLPKSKIVVDQVWSNGRVKSASARFWPQCERIKAASYLAKSAENRLKASYTADCLSSVDSLIEYLKPLESGLWNDSRDSSGVMVVGVAKASSLYHIAGAIIELNRLVKP